MPIKPLFRFVVLCAVVAALTACALFAKYEVTSRAMRVGMPLGQKIGALTLLSAVEWRANRPDFGGFSGLELGEGGGFVAITDKAHWARARLVLDGDGILTGIDGLEIGRLNGADGTDLMFPFTDSEALTQTADGAYLISFENKTRIGRFATLRASEETLPIPPGFEALPVNGGLESVLALPDGRIIALAETSGDWAKGFPGWIIRGDQVSRFSLARNDWYVPTDLSLGPEGEWIYLIERRFTLIGGFGIRIRRFALTALQDAARIEPELLAEVGEPPLVENYEALATARDTSGRTILYLLSDDNFTTLQKTLFVQFRVDQ